MYNFIVSFDVESNGLHGEGFAVAGCVLNLQTEKIEDTIYLVCPIDMPTDWVKQNVLPILRRETHKSARLMRDAFWEWLIDHKFDDCLVMADVAYPVETRFLAECQDDDLVNREWAAPYPLFDVSSLLLAAGFNPDIDRVEMVRNENGWNGYELSTVKKHDPLDDAIVSALCAKIALERLGIIHKAEVS